MRALGPKIALAVVLTVAVLPAVAAGPAVASPSLPRGGSTTAPLPSTSAAPAPSPTPLLAFYYSWFDKSSWSRAKVDYPLLGRYTSDDPQVMRQHIRWAKAAGIDGFIVSWKDTPTNDRRLSLLAEVARTEQFKLAMIYQGLDFHRRPLPADRVAADFAYYARTYAQDPVFFRLGGKPLTVWSGTWAYSHADVARVVTPVRARLTVLNTEKALAGYERLADVTDGDAYYWSSVNPGTNHNYSAKLNAFGRAVHAHGQYWMAPFAPGFDARLVGGSRTVARQSGTTLRTEYATAVDSSPDVLGLISWNEFSENSYVEPSQRFGHQALDVLADLRHARAPAPLAAVDSSEPPAGPGGPAGRPGAGAAFHLTRPLAVLGGFIVIFFVAIAATRPRIRRRDEELGLLRSDPGRPQLEAAQRTVLPPKVEIPSPETPHYLGES